MNRLSILLQVAMFPVPWPLRRRALNLFFGWDIAPTAHIGFSVILARQVRLSTGARIGSLNFVRNLDAMELGTGSRIGNMNWITGHQGKRHFAHEPERQSQLVLGRESAVTHRHLIDCTDRVEIGDFSIVAGWRSQILTHSINIANSRQESKPVTIGSYCFVGTASIILKGSSLPDFSILAAGSVLTKRLNVNYGIYCGNPAIFVRKLDMDLAYFRRRDGYVA